MGPSCPLVSAHALSGFRDKSPIPAARRFHLLDAPDIWAILRTLEGVDDKLLEDPAFARLPDELEDGEIPESVVWNRNADVYVATDRRIIHLQRAVWSKSIKSVASYLYSDLRSFRADTGFASLGCNMVLVKGGVKTLPMKPQTRQRFATVVRSHMPTHAVPGAPGLRRAAGTAAGQHRAPGGRHRRGVQGRPGQQVSETDPRPAALSQPPKTPSPSTQSNPRKGAWIGCGTIVAVLVVLVATMCSFGDDSPTPTPTATPTPAPTATPLSVEDLELLAREILVHYHELLSFKDDPDFHFYCYAVGGPYSAWVERGKAIGEKEDMGILAITGIVSGELWQMGVDYCRNQGQETEYTEWLKERMDSDWLASKEFVQSGPKLATVFDVLDGLEQFIGGDTMPTGTYEFLCNEGGNVSIQLGNEPYTMSMKLGDQTRQVGQGDLVTVLYCIAKRLSAETP